MRWVVRQLIVRKLVVSIGEKEVSHKRPFLRQAKTRVLRERVAGLGSSRNPLLATSLGYLLYFSCC